MDHQAVTTYQKVEIHQKYSSIFKEVHGVEMSIINKPYKIVINDQKVS